MWVQPYSYNDRYQMMMKCWEAAPDNRPSFKELYKDTSKYAQLIAGYLEIDCNPFAGMVEVTTTKENDQQDEVDGCECTVSIQVTPATMDTSVAEGAVTNTTD